MSAYALHSLANQVAAEVFAQEHPHKHHHRDPKSEYRDKVERVTNHWNHENLLVPGAWFGMGVFPSNTDPDGDGDKDSQESVNDNDADDASSAPAASDAGSSVAGSGTS